jgi:hypothetical protein
VWQWVGCLFGFVQMNACEGSLFFGMQLCLQILFQYYNSNVEFKIFLRDFMTLDPSCKIL